jgi:hypothetical protein
MAGRAPRDIAAGPVAVLHPVAGPAGSGVSEAGATMEAVDSGVAAGGAGDPPEHPAHTSASAAPAARTGS